MGDKRGTGIDMEAGIELDKNYEKLIEIILRETLKEQRDGS